MVHVRFKEAWHGKAPKQYYKLSGAQYATPLHIDETPHDLFMLVCLLCCLFLSGLLLTLASVSFRSCEDPLDYIHLSSSWTRSSSLRDLRQDDHTLEITTIFAMLVCSLLLCQCYDAYHLLVSLPNCHVKPLTHHVLANR